MQGRENDCTTPDLVLSSKRQGGLRFVKDEHRLNVGLSRSIDHFVLTCDVQALDNTKVRDVYLDSLSTKEFQVADPMAHHLLKNLNGGFDYFAGKRMVFDVLNPRMMPQAEHVDLLAVNIAGLAFAKVYK